MREGTGEFLRVDKNVDSLYNCNYVMFQNTNFSDKWFYAFMERIEYVNSKVSRVYLKMDSYQTFMFNYSLPDVFIERQTFGSDSYNTLVDTPAGGELKCVYEHIEPLQGSFFILFNSNPCSEDASGSDIYFPTIGNYSIPCIMYYTNMHAEMSRLVQAVSNKGRADRIQACYYAPTSPVGGLFSDITQKVMSKGDLNIMFDISVIDTIPNSNLTKDITVNIPYTPTYKKELSYPYAKLEVVDKITGHTIELDLSKFADPLNPQFRIMTTITDSPEYKVIPLNYNGIAYSIENALSVEPATEMPVFSSSYAKYLKDNKTSNLINGALSASSAIGSIMSGNVAGAVSSFGNIAQIVNADNVAKSQPNQCKGIKGDACDFLNFEPSLIFRLKVMDSYHMDIARNFWKCYGYPVRKITTFSNTSNRYNFIKTVDCSIIADTIPTEYQKELESMYDKGVTIWNSNYLEY
jgi:hypothetical protein